MSDALKPEQDEMTPGRRAFEAYCLKMGTETKFAVNLLWNAVNSYEKSAWEAAAAAVIADAQRGGE